MTAELPGEPRDFRVGRLIGREAERRELRAALDRANRFSAPQFLTLLGSAGVGKTRLLTDWTQEVEKGRDFKTVYVSAKGDGAEAGAFGVVRALLSAHLGITADMPPADVAERLREELKLVFGDRRVSEIAGLLGGFLGLAPSQGPLMQSLAMRPEQEADLARAVLCRFLEEDARRNPTAYVIDDVHCADDASLDLLARLRRELGETTLVLVVAARPELLVRRPDWASSSGSHVRLDLGGLGAIEMDVFIQCALGAKTLTPGLAERAAVESGGNPSLLLDLLSAYHEHGHPGLRHGGCLAV